MRVERKWKRGQGGEGLLFAVVSSLFSCYKQPFAHIPEGANFLHTEPSPQLGFPLGLLFAPSPFFCFRWIVENLRSELGRKKKGIGKMKIRGENRGKRQLDVREKKQRARQ